jgi:hypothetical protein
MKWNSIYPTRGCHALVLSEVTSSSAVLYACRQPSVYVLLGVKYRHTSLSAARKPQCISLDCPRWGYVCLCSEADKIIVSLCLVVLCTLVVMNAPTGSAV